ncbi:MAG: hypothetical protein O6850_07565, partial [Acidobacteria bacterium]|nr:hypothetical protein [Acidobacteriota bacterium]
MNEDIRQKLRGEIRGKLRGKIEDWLDFYRELEIDVLVSRAPSAVQSQTAHEVSAGFAPQSR